MWFRRFIAWLRARFSAPALDDATDTTTVRTYGFDGAISPIDPEFTRRQFFYPRDPLKTFGLGPTHDAFTLEPTSYESPTTIPLRRVAPPVNRLDEQPTLPLLPPLPSMDETPIPTPASTTVPAPGREPVREPSQPVASEPLPASLQRLSDLPDSTDIFDLMDDLDDGTRRLLFLRRLVRQRVYNEGFALDQTPRQYRRSLGLSDEPDQPERHN